MLVEESIAFMEHLSMLGFMCICLGKLEFYLGSRRGKLGMGMFGLGMGLRKNLLVGTVVADF